MGFSCSGAASYPITSNCSFASVTDQSGAAHHSSKLARSPTVSPFSATSSTGRGAWNCLAPTAKSWTLHDAVPGNLFRGRSARSGLPIRSGLRVPKFGSLCSHAPSGVDSCRGRGVGSSRSCHARTPRCLRIARSRAQGSHARSIHRRIRRFECAERRCPTRRRDVSGSFLSTKKRSPRR